MFSLKYIVLLAAISIQVESSAIPVPVAAPQFSYANVIPQNIQPFARQVSVVHRALNPLVASPFSAPVAPFAAPVPYAAPVPAPFTAPLPAPFVAPLSAPFAAPLPAPLAAPVEQYAAGPPALPLGTPYSAFPYGPAAYPYAFPFRR